MALSDLLKSVVVSDVISEETEMRPEVTAPMPFQELATVENENDFAPRRPDPQVETPVVEEDYNAEENARSLVYTLQSIDSTVLSAAVVIKCRKKAGGTKGLKKMKSAVTKRAAGAELTEAEVTSTIGWEAYKADLDRLNDAIKWTPEVSDRMMQAAIPYCEATKFTMGAGTAFWATYTGTLVERVMLIAIS